jgi:hypothetical protein
MGRKPKRINESRVRRILSESAGDWYEASHRLRVSKSTLYRWLDMLGIKPSDFRDVPPSMTVTVSKFPTIATEPTVLPVPKKLPCATPPEPDPISAEQGPRDHKLQDCWCGKQHVLNPASFGIAKKRMPSNIALSYAPRIGRW